MWQYWLPASWKLAWCLSNSFSSTGFSFPSQPLPVRFVMLLFPEWNSIDHTGPRALEIPYLPGRRPQDPDHQAIERRTYLPRSTTAILETPSGGQTWFILSSEVD